MRCAVFNCDNNNNKNNESSIRFYCFPKDKVLRKQWVHFCRRKDQFNVKTSRICCAHFAPDDIERNLQFEMGLCQKNGYKLKPGTIPTLDSKAETVSLSSRSNRMQARATQDMIACLIQQTPVPAEAAETEEAEKEPTVAEGEDSTSNDFFVEIYTETLKDRITSLENEVETLKRKNFILTENEKCFQQQVRSLEKLLQKSEFERGNMEDKLKKIFTAGQVNKLKNGLKRIQWSEADIAQSITLYSTSAKAYKLLRRKNFPLPGVRTLQSWAHKVDISPGIIEPVVKILSAATQLDEAQKVCILSFDEMKTRKTFCYDRSSDSTLAPANYVQVAMLRGLMVKWKQPIFYAFDCQMTVEILVNILATTKQCGYHVVAIVSDLGGGNRGLFRNLQISMDKPWFLHDESKIFVFSDVPHLIKLLRNHFIDQGFVINGKSVKKEIIVRLLSCTSSELTITHKISSSHLNVVGPERQKVKMATKLFSHTIAQSLTRAASLGLLSDQNWQECFQLFKTTNDWFDVMNVRIPTEDSRKRAHAYGLALDIQDHILDQMSKLMTDMRVIGKDNLLPFQRGIIQSNNAVKMLLTDLKNRFKLNYILTYRLNQDVLENFFGVIRAKEDFTTILIVRNLSIDCDHTYLDTMKVSYRTALMLLILFYHS